MNAKLLSETFDARPGQATVADEYPEAVAADPTVALPAVENEHSTLGLVELLLKNPQRADSLNRQERRQAELIPRFLSIALASYVLFSVAMIVILSTTTGEARPHRYLPVPSVHWADRGAVALLVAYNFGLVAATCICLPSFYFFTLLAGVRMSMLQIVGQVVRCKASSAIVLVGILPIYVAVVLGLVIFGASPRLVELVLYVGLVLPFIAGFEGVRAIYRGVLGMAETLPPERRCRRECFLRRLTLSWAAVYTAVSPVLIYQLWNYLGK